MPLWYQNFRSSMLVLQSLAGTAVFGYALERKEHFSLRLLLSLTVGFLLAWLYQRVLYIFGSDILAIASHALVSTLNLFNVYLILRQCLKEDRWTVLFYAVSGTTASGMAGFIKTLVKLIPDMDALAHHDLGIFAVDLLCYGGLYAVLFFAFRPYTDDRALHTETRTKAVFSAAVLFFSLMMSWIPQSSASQSVTSVLLYSILTICLMGMIFVVQFSVLEHSRMTSHMETLRELVHQQRLQYETSRETVQVINEKYHDLKKMLNGLQRIVPSDELQELKESIAHYDLHIHTGNDVLDVVLTEKMEMCHSKGIELTCTLNGTDFDFVEDLDLYALFNNALSNAVNAVIRFPEGKAKYISVSSRNDDGFVTVHVENPCSGEMVFEDGLPQTGDDPTWHGFGMKSMRRTAEKYGGAISAQQENGCFMLDILLVRS